MKKNASTSAVRATIPPTTPPAMAPALTCFEEFVVDATDVVCDDDWVEEVGSEDDVSLLLVCVPSTEVLTEPV